MSAPFPVQRAAPSALPKVGEVVAQRYTIERFIARGGMSHVFAARHAALDSVLALKVLDPKLFQGVKDAKLRFIREAKLASRLRHPSIVEVFDIGVTESGLPFIAMELLDGCSLSKILREEAPLPWPRARDFVLQVLDALQVAHAAGAVHRDVKPDNCLVLRDSDHLKLLDFGIARVEDQTQVTVAGSVMGTPHYLSPEQGRGATTDARSDVYSAGVLLYELLTGHCPFEEGTAFEIISAQVTEPPPPLSSQIETDHLPDGLQELLDRVLAKDPDMRPPDAGSFAVELRALDRVPEKSGVTPGVWIGAAVGAFAIGLATVGMVSLLSIEPVVLQPLLGEVRLEATAAVADSKVDPTPEGGLPPTVGLLAEPYDPSHEDDASDDEPLVEVEIEEDPEEDPEGATTPDEKPRVRRTGSSRKRRVTRGVRKAAASCAKFAPPGGAQVPIHAEVTSDGSLGSIRIKPPYAGSVLGRCVARALGNVNVGSGPPMSFDERVRVGS